ncbi:hypothetical protein DICPUDRAFT_93025 [Dictyostelium purpureum]|uniref:Uncharacterized protein n=1 Tax=Dictyostelium purpureum TaxID=5786 RepID=F1A0W1_DICPU|nr:uncharacterized protein DICPUDRAFT_93025 [Dictyostelium purpureum]EGC30179.1 hypothetical protein DICPUDRAFT_93025 [Dictyostelium purpureum]|eukprot:XP_003293305.1 hypothetical protein DICPUDRAFT_93025 [Dictyostelium purpureum]
MLFILNYKMLFKSLGSIVNQSQSSSPNYSSSEDNLNTCTFSKSPVPSSSPLSSSYGSNHNAHTNRSNAPSMVFSRPYWSSTNGF